MLYRQKIFREIKKSYARESKSPVPVKKEENKILNLKKKDKFFIKLSKLFYNFYMKKKKKFYE